MPYKTAKARRAYSRKHYKANRQRHIQQAMVRRARRAKEIRQWIIEFKAEKSCTRCPENDPACLDFHHRQQSSKTVEIALASKKGWSRARLMKEIAKCDLLCANCHRKEHARQRQSTARSSVR